MNVYSNGSRYEHNLTESLANPDKRDIALGQIFDALDEAIHKGSYAKVITQKAHYSGILKSYYFLEHEDKWELHLQINGQHSHSTSVYGLFDDDPAADHLNPVIALLTHDSAFTIREAQESK